MKKIILAILLVLIVSLSACSLSDYLPGTTSENDSDEEITLNDTFVFVGEDEGEGNLITGEVVGPPVQEDEDEESEEMETEDEESQEEVEDEEVSQETQEEVDEQDVQEELDGYVLATITATEGDKVSLSRFVAQDPDGDRIDYEYGEPFDEEGTWQTQDGDEGSYLVSITATDGVLSTTEQIQVVIAASNKGPVIDCPAEFSVEEGELIELPCTIYDKEGDEVTFEVSGFMEDLEYQTDFEDAGEHTVIVTASDGSKTTVKTIDLLIENKNRAPVVQEVDDIEAMEGDLIELEFDMEDPDGDQLFVAYPLVFDDEGKWQTARGDAGTYELEAIITDAETSVKVPVLIEVDKVNVPPTFEPIDDIIVDEGEKIVLPLDVIDDDGDELEIEISGFMTGAVYTTTYDDAGEYEVNIKVTDGKHTVEQDVAIMVNDVNRPPVFIVK